MMEEREVRGFYSSPPPTAHHLAMFLTLPVLCPSAPVPYLQLSLAL